MKIGVLTVVLNDLPLPQALDYLQSIGVEAVELGAGNYASGKHLDPDALLASADARRELRQLLADHGMSISALSCHGNPIHPSRELAREHQEGQHRAIQLASELEVDTVNGFSGCPGDSDNSRWPNWVTCAWPPEYREILDWQWTEKVIPFWQREAEFARGHGITRLAMEMHPGFVVYNPETALRLREAVGPAIGVNFDPSHLFWQGIDVTLAARELGQAGAIFHVHAKDTGIDPHNTARNGVLDTKSYARELERSWLFRTVGYGHDLKVWRDLVSTFRLVGYDGVLSIEHEDALMSGREGLEKAVRALKEVVISTQPGVAYWV